MKERYQRVWNQVEPDPELLEQTARKMAEETRPKRFPIKRAAAICCTLALLFGVTGWFAGSHNDPFTLVAYAADGELIPLAKGSEVPLLAQPELAGVEGYYTPVLTYCWQLGFHCEGKNLESITFTTDQGEFLRKYRLTFEERADLDYMKQLGIIHSVYHGGKDRYDEGYADAYALEGQSFTVPYDEQDSRTYCYQIVKEGEAGEEIDEAAWLENLSVEVTVTARFKDGSEARKNVRLTTDGEDLFALEQ